MSHVIIVLVNAAVVVAVVAMAVNGHRTVKRATEEMEAAQTRLAYVLHRTDPAHDICLKTKNGTHLIPDRSSERSILHPNLAYTYNDETGMIYRWERGPLTSAEDKA